MKTAVTITVRMKSKRLPMKAMKKIAGKTVIEHLIERIKASVLPDEIILCTSSNPQDNILVDVARENNIACFRGDEEDVLNRLFGAAKKHNIDFIVSTTGDNPLTDPEHVDKIIRKFNDTDADYITCLDLPLGTFSYGLKCKALGKTVELKKEKDTEIWSIYFSESNLFRKAKLDIELELKHPEIRLTIDTPEDFELFEKIYEELYRPGEIFSLKEVLKFLGRKPELKAINRGVHQRVALDVDMSDLVR